MAVSAPASLSTAGSLQHSKESHPETRFTPDRRSMGPGRARASDSTASPHGKRPAG